MTSDKIQAYKSLFAIMTLTLLSVVGMAMPYPILTPLLLDEGINSLNQFMSIPPKILLAGLLTAYPLGMLLGSSFIGSISDVYGRKKTLLLTTFGSASGYLVAAFSITQESFLLLLTARFITGLCEGNVAVARAMTADLHPVIDKTRGMSFVYSVTYGGWLIGPLVGGYLMVLGADIAFLLACLITLLSALVIIFFVQDARLETAKHNANISILVQHAVRNNSYTLLKQKPIQHVFYQYLLIMLGLNAFYEFLPVWLFEALSQDSIGIGHMTALVTLAMVATSILLIERFKKHFGIKPLIILGLGIFGITQCFTYAITTENILIYCLISGASIAFFNILLPVFLSDKFNDVEPGKLFGLLTSIFCMSNVIIALVGGIISLLSATLTLICGGLLILIGMFYFGLYFRHYEAKENALKEG